MRQLFEAAVSWSYDGPAKGGLHHAHYPGRVANRMDLLKYTPLPYPTNTVTIVTTVTLIVK